ncbi:hypothetical protein C8F04DRAFT_1233828 [Mycena alexandri]|uniref:Uncharacterized protein n=1 Tax=Mycena alexandri TaxID=1745969 RepID=A0AAD6SWU4_9AGAR|nr:hypothetical protein C8F04DRAFT_1233828 [Mycena alexandri]
MSTHCSIGIYTVSPHLPKEHVDHKIRALANAIHEASAERHKLRKYEMLIKNVIFDPPMMALGFAAPEPIVVMRVEFETAEQMFAFNDDTEVQRHLTVAAEEIGLRIQSSQFSVDVETRISKPAHSGLASIPIIGRLFAKKRFRVIGVHQVPADLSQEEFKNKISAFLDQACAIPVIQEKMLQLEMLPTNNVLSSKLQSQGITPPEPTILLWAESESFEHMVELMGNSELRKLAGGQGELQKGVKVFSVDVISSAGED